MGSEPLFPNGPTPTVEMLKAGKEELAKWLGKTPAEIDDLWVSCVWFVMYRAAPVASRSLERIAQ